MCVCEYVRSFVQRTSLFINRHVFIVYVCTRSLECVHCTAYIVQCTLYVVQCTFDVRQTGYDNTRSHTIQVRYVDVRGTTYL